MTDKFSKAILVGILVSLLIIAFKLNNLPSSYPAPAPVSITDPIAVESREEIIQLAPNRIAVINTDWRSPSYGTIDVFDYDGNTKKFSYSGSGNYTDSTK